MFKIIMTRTSDNVSHVMMFSPVATRQDADNIVARFNRLNQETAKMTGKAIRFVFSVARMTK